MRNLVACLCLAMLVACNSAKSPNETTQNRAPTISTMSMSPAFGISFLTPFSFSASASDPDGDAVTYAWNIAGNTASGASGTITFATGGNGTATVTVSDGKGLTASDSRTFVVGSLTGVWDVVAPFCSNNPFTLTLTQTGGVATGSFNFPTAWCAVPAGTPGITDPAEPGSITAAAAVDIRLKVGVFIDFYIRGTMASTGRTITGGLFGSGFSGQPFTATKR